VEFNHYLEYYRNATDLNVSKDGVSVKEKEKKRSAQGGFSRFFINLGTKDSLGAANLIGIINEYTSTRDIEIGKIDILRKFSFFEVDKNYEELILNSFKNATFGDVKIEVQLSKPESPDKRQDSSRSEGGFRKSNNYRKDRPSNDYKSKDKRSFGSAKPRFDKDKKRKRN